MDIGYGRRSFKPRRRFEVVLRSGRRKLIASPSMSVSDACTGIVNFNRQLRPTAETQKSNPNRYLSIGCAEYRVCTEALTLPKSCPKTATSQGRITSQTAADCVSQQLETQYRNVSWPPLAAELCISICRRPERRGIVLAIAR
jgi:hypothetical protein